MRTAKYPMVQCADPAIPPEPGYVVCPHVQDPQDVGYFQWATEHQLGQIICHACHNSSEPLKASVAILMCAHCCRQRGLLPDQAQ